MKKYHVNTNPQSNEDHEVHQEGCNHSPDIFNRKDLGYFSNCRDAVKEAKKYYLKANGCFYCSGDCHTS